MHAIVCHQHGGPEVMQCEEIPEPKPASGEVLIKAEAIGVNYVDTMRRSGKHPSAPNPPFTPGIEVCGRVAAVGEGASRFRDGDRVIGRCVTHGSYAEFVCVDERFTVPCPDTITPEEGASLFVTGQTAYHALVTKGKVAAGEWVLITAASGGVGLMAVLIAKVLGAKVVAATGSAEKYKLAKTFGADVTVNYTNSDWSDQVRDATGGMGANLIIESVGGDIASGCIACWAPGGRMVVYGKASGEPAAVSGDDLLFGNRAVYGLAVGSVIEDEEVMRRAADQLSQWLESRKLRLHVDAFVGLDTANGFAVRSHDREQGLHRMDPIKIEVGVILAP